VCDEDVNMIEYFTCMYENRIMQPLKLFNKGQEREYRVIEGVSTTKGHYMHGTITMKLLCIINIC
jgi:hypothetical protein